MNQKKMPARRIQRIWLAAAILVAGLVLRAFLIDVSAENYEVTPGEDGNYYAGDVQVIQVPSLPDAGDTGEEWTVVSLTVDGDTYRDADGNWYYPTAGGPYTCHLELKADTLLVPIQVDSGEAITCTILADGTVLTMDSSSLEDVAVTSIVAVDMPDGNGVVHDQKYKTDGYYYQPDGKGLFTELPFLDLEYCTLPGLDEEKLYGVDWLTDQRLWCYVLPETLEIRLAENYAYNRTVIPYIQFSSSSTFETAPAIQAEFVDERTFRIALDNWTGVAGIHIYDLNSFLADGERVLVEEDGSGNFAAGGVPVYPIEGDLDGWVPIVAGAIYQDADGNYYTPRGDFNAVTFQKEGIWLPTSYPETATSHSSSRSISFTEGWTIVSYTDVSIDETYFPAAPLTAVQALGEPILDEVGAVQSQDMTWYFYNSGNDVFQTMIKLTVTVQDAPQDLGFRIGNSYSGGIYGASYGLGTVTGYVSGYSPEVRLTGGYIPEADSLSLSSDSLSSVEVYTYEEDPAAVILWFSEPYPKEVALELRVKDAVTITFPTSQFYTVSEDGEYLDSESFLHEAGQDFIFTLKINGGYYSSSGDAALKLLSCTISTQEQSLTPEMLSYDAENRTGTIPKEYLTDDCSITFEVELTGAEPLAAVEPVSGPGYRLVTSSGAMPGAEDRYIRAVLIVQADYDQSAPVLELPEGYTAELDARLSQGNAGISEGREYMRPFQNEVINQGSVAYGYIIYSDAGSFPEGNLKVTVTGVEPNYTPPSGGGGGGGSSGGSKEEIRVENQLNQEGASSDTKLWPNGTKEQNGVSTTTVTDKELEALINLAQQHIEDIKELEGDGYKEGIIVIEDLRPSSSIHTYILKLTESQFQRIAEEEWDRFTVQTPAGSLSLYGETIREVAGLEGAVDFTISRLEYEGRPGVDVTLTVDGKPVTAFSEVYGIRAFVPYAPAEEEDVNALLMDYIHEDGTAERVTESFYDAAAGGVYVFSSHLSKFGVAYRPTVYTDVGADHWASPYVTFLAARGLLDSGTTFRPDDKATRGELLELLSEALSAANLPSRAVQVYSDVPAASSVARAASWVYYNNLAGSITSGGTLRPNEAVTREDMAALTGNIASGVGLRLRSKGLDTGYTDLGDVASYARASVTRLRAAGILEMADNYKFNPKATLNRGEMAQIVAALLSNL